MLIGWQCQHQDISYSNIWNKSVKIGDGILQKPSDFLGSALIKVCMSPGRSGRTGDKVIRVLLQAHGADGTSARTQVGGMGQGVEPG